MLVREELIWDYSDDLDVGCTVYDKAQADEVMDAMEMCIKKLEAENEKLKAELRKERAWNGYQASENGWV